MAETLQQDVTESGLNQGDLVKVLKNIRDNLNELTTDHATLLADVTAIRTALVATHAKLDADAGVTDTDYASSNDPAALTTSALTNSTAITLSKG